MKLKRMINRDGVKFFESLQAAEEWLQHAPR